MAARKPTLEDYWSHTGLHYHQLWVRVGPSWVCPACGRTKYEIMRWTKRFPNSPGAFMDWVAALHTHHDHSKSYFTPGVARFPETVICHQCNVADGQVKRKLKLPADFSFSPAEIRTFVLATPHDKHAINYDVARVIYGQLTGLTLL